MDRAVFRNLVRVRRRQRVQSAVRAALWGLLLGAVTGLAAGLWRLLVDSNVPVTAVAALLVVVPLVAGLAGWFWPRGWLSAARAIDLCYRLKDRTVTALEFAQRQDGSPWHRLQLQDAAEHLKDVRPAEVVPLQAPRWWPWAVAVSAVAVGLLLWPTEPNVQAQPQPALPGIVAVAEEIERDLQRLDQLAEQEKSEELKELVEQLRQAAEDMKQDGVDLREALATLSEMQEAIAAQQAEYNDALVSAQLQSLGAALRAAGPLNAAGQALENERFEQAADELEKADLEKLKPREAKATAERLKRVAESMNEAGLGQLSDAVSELSEGIQRGAAKRAAGACRRLSGLVRKHAVRRRINRFLLAQLRKLGECKSRCRSACRICRLCGKPCGGRCQGEGPGGGNSLARGLNPRRSTTPSSKWGRSTSGDLFGEATELQARRKLEELAGQLGEGPSDVETESSPEGRQQARRSYREVYEKYRKMSEAVLESEPIPLGHRQVIRRYFESIRPQREDALASGGSE